MGKGLSYLKNWGIGVNYCWNFGPSKLLLHFIEYHLDQLKSKHTKIAINSATQYFEGCFQKKCLLKVWSFLFHPPQNRGPVKFLRNWTETNYLLMANIFKLQEYQIFGLVKMHNMCKIWILYSVCEKVWFMINGPLKILFFNFFLFSSSRFQMAIVKNLIMDFNGGFLVISTTSQIFLIYTYLTMKRQSFFFKFVWLCNLFLYFFTTSLLMIHLKCTVAHYAN